jgi:antitoxin (DNA-binding transcriptional repressor) of toxin-antitoxin stability system
MANMKVATVRQIQHNLAEVLTWVADGQEVQVFRRKKLVARLLPPGPDVAKSPDFLGRAHGIWGKKPRGKALSALVSAGRGKY